MLAPVVSGFFGPVLIHANEPVGSARPNVFFALSADPSAINQVGVFTAPSSLAPKNRLRRLNAYWPPGLSIWSMRWNRRSSKAIHRSFVPNMLVRRAKYVAT